MTDIALIWDPVLARADVAVAMGDLVPEPGLRTAVLISLGITVAFVASWGATLGLLDGELEFWWELALLIVIMLLGHWVEMRSWRGRRSRARRRAPTANPRPSGTQA